MKKIIPTLIKRTGWHQTLAMTIAFLLTVLSVLQLFWFEDMPGELSTLLPVEWSQASIVIAAAYAIGEVLAVAYFLPLALSALARWCLRVVAIGIPLAWIGIMKYALFTGQAANAAYLGAKVDLPLSWLHVIAMMLLLVAMVVVVTQDLRKS